LFKPSGGPSRRAGLDEGPAQVPSSRGVHRSSRGNNAGGNEAPPDKMGLAGGGGGDKVGIAPGWTRVCSVSPAKKNNRTGVNSSRKTAVQTRVGEKVGRKGLIWPGQCIIREVAFSMLCLKAARKKKKAAPTSRNGWDKEKRSPLERGSDLRDAPA